MPRLAEAGWVVPFLLVAGCDTAPSLAPQSTRLRPALEGLGNGTNHRELAASGMTKQWAFVVNTPKSGTGTLQQSFLQSMGCNEVSAGRGVKERETFALRGVYVDVCSRRDNIVVRSHHVAVRELPMMIVCFSPNRDRGGGGAYPKTLTFQNVFTLFSNKRRCRPF